MQRESCSFAGTSSQRGCVGGSVTTVETRQCQEQKLHLIRELYAVLQHSSSTLMSLWKSRVAFELFVRNSLIFKVPGWPRSVCDIWPVEVKTRMTCAPFIEASVPMQGLRYNLGDTTRERKPSVSDTFHSAHVGVAIWNSGAVGHVARVLRHATTRRDNMRFASLHSDSRTRI